MIGEPGPYYARLIASDGHLEPDSYTITVASSDKDFMDSIVSQIVEKQGCKGSLLWDAGADTYKLKITDKQLWERLTGKYTFQLEGSLGILNLPRTSVYGKRDDIF